MVSEPHYQARKPRHWILADEVLLPTGVRITGSKARVYEALRLARDTAHCFCVGQQLAPAGWVPVWVFREPWCGGSAGDRRLRDLRQLGVQLDGQPFDAGTSGLSSSWIWRLAESGGTAPSACGSIPRKKAQGLQARDSSAPLAGTRFVLCSGGRPAAWAGELVDLSPGMPHAAAPAAALAKRVVAGDLGQAEAQEEYRQQLVGAYRSGELARSFRAGTSVTVCCEAPFDALEVLGRALAKLGGTVG